MNQSLFSLALLILLIGWSIGLGFRFAYEYFSGNKNFYMSNLFDALFDWLGLCILGIANFYILLRELFVNNHVNDSKSKRDSK